MEKKQLEHGVAGVRDSVALNWMDHDYEGYWQGIAVHNGDPMVTQHMIMVLQDI